MRFRGLIAAHRVLWVGLVSVLLVACGGEPPRIPTAPPSPSVPPTAASSTATAGGSPTVSITPVGATSITTLTPPGVGMPAIGTATTASGTPVSTAQVAGVVITPTPQAKNADPAQAHIGDGGDGYGFNVWGLDANADFRDKVYGNVQGAGFGWMRQQVAWAAMEPKKGNFGTDTTAFLDKFVDGAAAKNLKVMLSVVKSPDWVGANGGLPTNAQDFTDYMTFLVQRYKGKVQAYEIWNEQNYALETGGKVSVNAYLPILKAGYQTVKKYDPKAVVVFGGLTPTGVDNPAIALNDVQYLRQIYAINGGEVKQYYDVLGTHPGSNCNPPDNAYPANPATNSCGTDPDGGRSYTKDNSFYFQRLQEQRKVMEDAGENGKKMWLTEFGWTTENQAKGYEYGKYVSETQQAQYLTRAFELGRSYPWMGVMFVWNLNFASITPPTDEKYPWGVLKADGSPRPAYTALKNVPK